VYRIGGILERVRKLRALHDPRTAEFCRKQKLLYSSGRTTRSRPPAMIWRRELSAGK